MRGLSWIVIFLGCFVTTIFVLQVKIYNYVIVGQLIILFLTGVVVLVFERLSFPNALSHCILISWILLATFGIVTESIAHSSEAFDEENMSDTSSDGIMSFSLVRLLNQAVLIFYIFTQGLTFRQTIFVMIPVYAIIEVSRSISYVMHRELHTILLVRCFGIIQLASILIAMSYSLIKLS